MIRASFKPRPGHINAPRFFNDWTSEFCAFFGGWGSGKTWYGTRKLLLMHLLNGFDDARRKTLHHSAIVAPSYQLATTINIPEFMRACAEINLDVNFCGDSKKFWFEIPILSTKSESSKIYIRSADNPKMITGWEVGAILCDEGGRYPKSDQPDMDPFLQCQGRLRRPARHRQMMTTTTHEGTNTHVYRGWIEKPSANHRHYVASTRENLDVLGQKYIDGLVANMSAELAAQYIDGLATDMGAAKMYYAFDAKVNIDDSLQWNQALPLRLSFDFNTNPGSNATLSQFYPDKEKPMLVTLREFHQVAADGRKLAEHIVQRIKAEFHNLPQVNPAPDHEWKFPVPMILYGDAAGSHDGVRHGSTGPSSWEDVQSVFRANNIAVDMRNVPNANPHVADRVATMNSVFKSASGLVRYKCRSCCEILLRDYRLMQWKDGEADKSNRKISHMSDAEGYKVFQLLPIRK